MKLEKISENQIRCTLTREDLASRQIKLTELAYGSEKARRLFQDMMQQAQTKFGWRPDNTPLMIEAIPVSEGSVMLNITKVEDPEELDTRFARFAPAKGRKNETAPVENADDILNLIRKLYDAKQKAASPAEDAQSAPREADPAKTPERPRQNVDFVRLYSFRSLDALIDAAGVLRSVYQGRNTLYKTGGDEPYQLVIHKSAHTPEEFNKICNILAEYGASGICTKAAEAHLAEHALCMIEGKALQKLGIVS